MITSDWGVMEGANTPGIVETGGVPQGSERGRGDNHYGHRDGNATAWRAGAVDTRAARTALRSTTAVSMNERCTEHEGEQNEGDSSHNLLQCEQPFQLFDMVGESLTQSVLRSLKIDLMLLRLFVRIVQLAKVDRHGHNGVGEFVNHELCS